MLCVCVWKGKVHIANEKVNELQLSSDQERPPTLMLHCCRRLCRDDLRAAAICELLLAQVADPQIAAGWQELHIADSQIAIGNLMARPHLAR